MTLTNMIKVKQTMKPIIFLILVTLLACSKQGENSEQNTEDIKSNTSIENVMSVSDLHNEQPVKTNKYKVGEPIELYDLIYTLLPENNANEISWDKLNNMEGIIWQKIYNDATQKNSRYGELNIKINGVKFEGAWDLILDDVKQGYTFVSLNTTVNTGGLGEYSDMISLEYWFKDKQYSATTLKEDSWGNGGHALYEVEFPDKKIFWIAIGGDAGTHLESFGVVVYLNKDEVKGYFE